MKTLIMISILLSSINVFAKPLHCTALKLKAVMFEDVEKAQIITGEFLVDYKEDGKAEAYIIGLVSVDGEEEYFDKKLTDCVQWSRPNNKQEASAGVACTETGKDLTA